MPCEASGGSSRGPNAFAIIVVETEEHPAKLVGDSGWRPNAFAIIVVGTEKVACGTGG
ncbi:hypothetical protein C0995_004096, partial [Termitomyces sp. Mi166